MIPRLYIDAPLSSGAVLTLSSAQAHYLRHVLRLGTGAAVRLFNGQSGEWSASIARQDKKAATVEIATQCRGQTDDPAITLMFAPLKRGPIDYLVEKATELGATCLQPVLTLRTVAQRVNQERMLANATEAAEQCERLSIPDVRPPLALDALLDRWPDDKTILFCDERGGPPMLASLLQSPELPAAVLIGPEGGFDSRERDWLIDQPSIKAVSLGPRILRAETAAVAALTLWQARAEIGPE